MSSPGFFNTVLFAWCAISAAIFAILLFINAPYGRHARSGWGPAIDAKFGWFAMEIPAVAVFASCFLRGNRPMSSVAWIFFLAWMFHYVYRSMIYPLLLGPNSKPIPILIVAFGFTFNVVNGYLNGAYLFVMRPLGSDGLFIPRILLGIAVFAAGFAIHYRADASLRNLGKTSDGKYRIPQGCLFDRISCPNYFGEMVEWTGWAVMTWSLPGLAFALWTTANLMPRALAHHRWYKAQFPDYPPDRKAVIPFLL